MTWKIPIGPQMDTEECQFGSTAIMAVVSGRVSKVVLDYSTAGWQVNLEVSTSSDPVSSGAEPTKKFVTAGDYVFAAPDLYDELLKQVPSFKPLLGDVIYVKPTADGTSLEMPVLGNYGKIGDRPEGYFALRRTVDPIVLQRTLKEMIELSE